MFLNKRKIIFLISIFILTFFFTYSDVKTEIVKVIDGDTIKIDNKKIRFSGIDTPELKQICINNGIEDPCGNTAKLILIEKIGNNKVKCTNEGKDQYNRILAECFINGESLSVFLVRSGYAFAYRKYSKKFIEHENYANINNIGMWSMKFEYPWDYRKKN